MVKTGCFVSPDFSGFASMFLQLRLFLYLASPPDYYFGYLPINLNLLINSVSH